MKAATKFTMKGLAEVLVANQWDQWAGLFAVDVFAALSALSFVPGNGRGVHLAATEVTQLMGSEWS